MHIKYYIWLARCHKRQPIIADFVTWFGKELGILEHNIDIYPKLSFVAEIVRAINVNATP